MRPIQIERNQRGSVLLEAMVSVVIFSLGILALVSMQTAAVRSTTDAKYRADASFLANQIVGQMWGEDPANLATYANGPPVGSTACPNTAAVTGSSGVVTAWLTQVASLLPGADADRQQVSFNGGVVTVRVCWLDRSATPAAYHNHVVVAQINKN